MSPFEIVATIMGVVFATGIAVGAILVTGIGWVHHIRRQPGPPPSLPPGGPDDLDTGPPTQPVEPDDRPWWANGR